MNDFNQPNDFSDRVVCFCHSVRYSEILQAIRQGSRTVHDLQIETLASTGCGGCESELLEILEAEVRKAD